ncbi:MAG TPA: cell envelope integrity protein TolA [Anaeromyxobacteraceae bacterium]|nr:cell envelope integrity protein TolA [Anaeromyxobacteraceae bacterium]
MSYLGPSLRRSRKRPERSGGRIAIAVIASIGAHAWLLAFLVSIGFGSLPPPREVQSVALAPLSASQWEANRSVSGAAQPPAPRLAPVQPATPPDERRPKGQYVDLQQHEPDAKVAKRTEPRFDADRDHQVEKETVSRYSGAEKWSTSLPAPSSGVRAKDRPPAIGDGGKDKTSSEGAVGKAPKQGTGKAEQLALPQQQPQVAMASPPVTEGESVRKREQLPAIEGGAPGLALPGDGEGGQRAQGAMDARLMPTADTYASLQGGPRSYGIKDLEEGDSTSLNTRRFKYATYYSQFYAAVAATWNPTGVFRVRDPDGTTYGSRDYVTRVDIVLDEQGQVKDLRMVSGSGLEFLDREALRAVRDAAPFPNPPRGIIDEQGLIRLGTWAFVFEAGHRPTAYRERPAGW